MRASGEPACVTAPQLDACADLEDGIDCAVDGTLGTCDRGACILAQCGNQQVEPGEACDGNNLGELTCSTYDFAEGTLTCDEFCQPVTSDCLGKCGDTRTEVEFGEACDDGNTVSGDGCAADCRSDESCGNGLVDPAALEQCDAGTPDDGDEDGCQADCQVARCGDGITDLHLDEECDAGADNSDAPDAPCRPSCRLLACGDGVVDALAGEVCDDGNREPGDGCSYACESDESCGDGIVNFVVGETCDDGGLASADGCSSRCTREELHVDAEELLHPGRSHGLAVFDSWRGVGVLAGGTDADHLGASTTWELGDSWRSGARLLDLDGDLVNEPAAAFDSLRGRIVACSYLGETFEYVSERWRLLTPATPAPSCYGSPMVYDHHRDRMVMLAEAGTWEYDGDDWAEVLGPGAPPSPRFGAAAYDPARRVVVFRGWNPAGTWEYDGTTWIEVVTATSPPAQSDANLVFDPDRGQVLFFGGPSATTTWAYDGVDWTELSVGSYAIGSDGQAYYDSWRRQIVFHGGFQQKRLTRILDASGWHELPLPEGPGARRDAAVAYQAARGEAILFGGNTSPAGGSTFVDDMWRHDGEHWLEIDAAVRPSARSQAAVAYDPDRQRVVLFGGDGPTGLLGDTWEWDGQAWTQLAVSGPSPRTGAAMAYDPGRGVMVLFGGSSARVEGFLSSLGQPPALGDTWEWDGANWLERAVSGPTPRALATLDYDHRRSQLVLFAGADANPTGWTLDASTWVFDGAAWTALAIAQPDGRARASTFWDAARGELVVAGGHNGVNFPGSVGALHDDWEGWVDNVAERGAALRAGAAMHYDVRRRRVVVTGGEAAAGLLATDERWAWQDLGVLAEACDRAEADVDDDGLLGCDDDDCRAVCYPTCPGAAPCGASAGYCGDGECGAIETSAMCPQDCAPPEICGDGRCVGAEPGACLLDCVA